MKFYPRLSQANEIIKMTWHEFFAYRVDFFLKSIIPIIVFFLVKYFLWLNIYTGNGNELIKGMSFQEMMQYHLWVLATSLVILGTNSFNMAQDIRFGKITPFLLYPMPYAFHQMAVFIGQTIFHFFVIFISFSFLIGFNLIDLPVDTITLILSIPYLLLCATMWFIIQFIFGAAAFWMEETWVLRIMFIIVAEFLSGKIFPLTFFPQFFQNLIYHLPFPHFSYFPVMVLMQKISFTDLSNYLVSLSWQLIVLILIASKIWRKGINNYTAAGM